MTVPTPRQPAQSAPVSNIDKIYAFTRGKEGVSEEDVQDVWEHMREKISQSMWRRRVEEFKKKG